jgi:hypothetical protein
LLFLQKKYSALQLLPFGFSAALERSASGGIDSVTIRSEAP